MNRDAVYRTIIFSHTQDRRWNGLRSGLTDIVCDLLELHERKSHKKKDGAVVKTPTKKHSRSTNHATS